jgi:arabinofuranosyltransferase
MRISSNTIGKTLTRDRSAGSVGRIVLELGALIVILLAAAAGLRFARGWPPVYVADLTSLDPAAAGFDVVGVHIPERNGNFAYSWSSGYTLAQLRGGYNAAPSYRASVRLRAANPAGPQPLTFLRNEKPLATVIPSAEFRIYRVLLPPGDTDDTALRFGFETQSFRPAGDARDLGVILTRMTLQPIASALWAQIGWLCLLGALLWGWLRWRGISAGVAALVCGLLLAALIALYATYRPAPLSFVLLASVAAAAIALGAVLAREAASQLALAALVLLVSFSGVIWPSWLTDDAFISFRYAQNLVAGNGLVYNAGERVEGYTNFLWTMLAALALKLGGDVVFLSYLSGVVLGLAILLLSYGLARKLIGPAWALVTALIVATSQSLLVYTARGSGLETGLFTLLALAGSACVIHPRAYRWYGPLFALATLTRPEGALLMGLTLLYTWLVGSEDTTHRSKSEYIQTIAGRIRATLPALGAYLLIVGPYFLWRATYYGDLLPNTFYAKTGGGLRQIERGAIYSGLFALTFGGPLLLLCLAPLLDGWRTALRSWRGYLLLLAGAYSAYIVAVGGDHFPGDRFFVPLVPWLALLLSDGMAWVYARTQRQRYLARLAPAALAVVLLLYAGNALYRDSDFNSIIKGDDESLGIWRELGWWLHDHGAPGESMAASGAGAVAYYSDRETIDLLGLNDKHIARVQSADIGAGTAGHEKRDPVYVLDVRRPTYIPQIWDDYFGGEIGLRGRYTLITIRTRYGRELKVWKRILN